MSKSVDTMKTNVAVGQRRHTMGGGVLDQPVENSKPIELGELAPPRSTVHPRRHTIVVKPLDGVQNATPQVLILDENSIPQIDAVYSNVQREEDMKQASRFSLSRPDDTTDESHKPLMASFNPPPETTNNKLSVGKSSVYGHSKASLDKLQGLNPTPTIADLGAKEYVKQQVQEFFKPTDNKLAMKLFGNRQAVIKERLRQEETARWIIHPCSPFRFYWDVCMMVLLVINMMVLPVSISFFYDDLSARWISFNSITDAILAVDIIINFRTGIITNNYVDEIILDPKEIAKIYAKTWFIVDLVSSVPMDYIIFISSENVEYSQLFYAGRALRIFRLLKLLSLIRLLRLSRLVRYIHQWEEFLTTAGMFMRIFNLVSLMLLLSHWNGCIQFLIPMLQDFPADSWVAIMELQGIDWTEQYTHSLFRALSHMLCIGYGRYPPASAADSWVTIISMMVGATGFAMFIGHATSLIQSFDYSKRVYTQKSQMLEEYMAYRKLPRNLRHRISDYYEHKYHGKMFDEGGILNELNEVLREEIVSFNSRDLVAKVPFFTHADPQFVSDIINKLQYEVFQPGDTIIREGTMGTGMYFIQEGIVDIVTKDNRIITSLFDGSYFGEICLLMDAKRVASVRAETYCNVYFLHREIFNDVLDNYPVMRVTMERVAEERLTRMVGDIEEGDEEESEDDEAGAILTDITSQTEVEQVQPTAPVQIPIVTQVEAIVNVDM